MDPSLLVDGLLRGVLGGRKKKSKNALRYLTGRKGAWLSNPQLLWTAAGVAWGVVETIQGSKSSTGSAGSMGSGDSMPPLPPRREPIVRPEPSEPLEPNEPIEPEVLRLIRLAVSAANADGTLTAPEAEEIARHAAAAGGSGLVAAEIAKPRPLADIVAGVTDPLQRSALYVLAYTLVRADEQVSGAERIYLARLAQLLDLSPDSVQRLEQDTNRRIDEQREP
jgi:uncharacterized membrane protein YebE (DUF533 family)